MSCMVKDGDPARVILEYAEAHQVDLIVLCSHGRSNLGRWILGSVADHLARYALMPALVVRADGAPALAAPDGRDAERLFCVLVPLDGCALAEAAIEPAAHLATALAPPQPAGLHLVVIVDPFEATVRQGVPEITVVDDATSYLIRLTDRLRAEYPRVTITWSVRSEADAATGILLVAEGGEDMKGASPVAGCDLIVMDHTWPHRLPALGVGERRRAGAACGTSSGHGGASPPGCGHERDRDATASSWAGVTGEGGPHAARQLQCLIPCRTIPL